MGVSNAQLVKEGVPIAHKYNGRSVAEQNSLDLSWDLLMSSEFEVLRSFLFQTQTELIRFRQLVVNSVMATDIVDKDLKALRNVRWEKAFKMKDIYQTDSQNSNNGSIEDSERDDINRKATIVIEHIIQVCAFLEYQSRAAALPLTMTSSTIIGKRHFPHHAALACLSKVERTSLR